MCPMKLSDLRAALSHLLSECANKFQPAELDLLLNNAAADLARRKPVHKRGTLSLEADQDVYAAPADLLVPLFSDWGQRERARTQPWDDSYPQRLPRIGLVDVAGVLMLEVVPAPWASQIANLGSEYPYTYAMRHTLGDQDGETTVPATQRDLLLLRALAEAMRVLAARGVSVPVQLGPSGDNRAKNGTPAALAEQLMDDFVEACTA